MTAIEQALGIECEADRLLAAAAVARRRPDALRVGRYGPADLFRLTVALRLAASPAAVRFRAVYEAWDFARVAEEVCR